MYSLQLTLGPTEEPVSLDEAKAHCRVDLDDDDTLLEDLIIAARESLESEMRRSFLTTYWTMRLDDFPRCGQVILLPRSPLQAVTSLAYTDGDGVEQTLSTDVYGVDLYSEPGRISLKPAQTWPSVYAIPHPVQIAFVAGWDDVLYVPAGIKAAIKLLVGHWYESREAAMERPMTEMPMGVQRLLWLNRVVDVA